MPLRPLRLARVSCWPGRPTGTIWPEAAYEEGMSAAVFSLDLSLFPGCPAEPHRRVSGPHRDAGSAPGVRTVSPPKAAAGTMQGVQAVTGEAEALLVQRCLRGDGAAWAEMVRAHQGRVYSLCYRFTGSPQDAEDLTQDVFLKIYSALHAWDRTRGALGVWVTSMTRNHLIDQYRRHRLQRASDSLDAGWDAEDGEARSQVVLTDTRPGPHAEALQRELEREVQQALTQVSPELREAVILRDLQDMDYREIAAVLRIPEGTVKSRISRGRAELARILRRSGREVS